MHVCMHTCINQRGCMVVCMHVCVGVSACISAWEYECMHIVRACVCMRYVFTGGCVHACVQGSMLAHMCVLRSVCLCVREYV